MASGSGSASSPSQDTDITALKTKLYDACIHEAQGHPKAVFHQNSIFEMEIIPNRDIQTLLVVAQKLIDEKLFKAVNDTSGLGWMLRTVEEAKKYRSLNTEQEIVYAIVDEAGEEGVWTKTIKLRSNLHEAIYKAAIKHLEGKNMICDMKSVEHPARKMYIKTTIRPSDRATGGAWFTDGILDEEFIETALKVLFQYITRKTFYHSSSASSPRRAKKGIKKMTPEEAKAARAKGLGPRMKTEEMVSERAAKKVVVERYLPMPAGYQSYPALNELTTFVEDSGITPQTLTAAEIQQLLDILIFDDKIEKVVAGPEGFAYRALKKSLYEEDGSSSLFTEVPCGRCPVFDLCEEGGPVGPSNCEYFNDWLSL